MTDTVTNDPTADQGPFRLDPAATEDWRRGVTPSLPGTREAIPKLEALQKKEEQDFASTQRALEPQYSALSKAYQERPTPAELAKVGPAPDARDYQKNSLAFASAMAIIGAIGSKFARIPGTAALSAFGGALKGWHEGNLEAYESGVKQWEENARAVIQNNNILLKKYDMEMQNRALNIDQISANIKMIAAQYHDKQMYDAASAQNITLMGQLRDKVDEWTNGPKGLERSIQPMVNEAAKIRAAVDLKAEQQALWVAQHGFTNPDGSPMSAEDDFRTRYLLQREGGKAMSAVPSMYNPTEIDQLARQELTGDHSWKANVGRGAQGSAKLDAVSQRVSEIMTAEGITPEERSRRDIAFAARRAGATREEAAVGQRAGAIAIAVQEASETIPNVERLAEANAGRGIAAWNALESRWKVQRGDPGFAEYVQQLNSLINLYGRVISGGGKGTVSDAEHAREMLNPNMPLSAVKGSLRGFKTEIGIAERAPAQVRGQIRGETPPATETPATAAPTAGTIPPGWDVKEH